MPVQGLDVVARAGAPAQRAQARKLLEQLAVNPGDDQARAAARELVDAYFNDPYLER
jgi:hypothetical protein